MWWFGLRDDRKGRIKDLLSGRADLVGVMAADNRLFEEVLNRYHTGVQLRDLPERFGDGTMVHLRFSVVL